MLRPSLVAVLIALVGAPAFAQAPQQEPPIRRLDRLDRAVRELNAIVRQGAATGRPVIVAPESLPSDLDGLRQRLDDMEAAQRAQTSTIESLTGELNQARRTATEAQAQVATLEARLATVEARPVAPPEPGPEEAAAVAPDGAPGQRAADEGSLGALRSGDFPSEPAAAFQRARQLLLEGDYAAASAGFQDFAVRFPGDARASEARYWLGETRYIREDYAGSAEAYIAALRGWPKASWAPDGVVKLASSLVALNRNDTACTALGEIGRRYPEASTSVKARAASVRTRAQCAA